MSTTRNQSFPITLQTGAQGLQEQTIILDRRYARTKGWLVFVNDLGGAAYVRIGLRDDNRIILDPVNSKFLEPGIDCPKSARWTALDAPADGTNLIVQVYVPTPLTSPLRLDVVFDLTTDQLQ